MAEALAFDRRWYQVLPVEGAVYEDQLRADSVFWNEGKWRTFIEPFLPPKRYRDGFIEVGCNAGLFLHCAERAGFTRVLGIESSRHYVEQADVFRRTLPGARYTVRRAAVGHNLDPETLPLCDVVLIANAHYYFGIPAFVDFLDAIRVRTRHLIIVSAKVKHRHGCPGYDRASVRGYCREWIETGLVADVPSDGDPAPRKEMFAVCFAGALRQFDVKQLYESWQRPKLTSQIRPEWRALAQALPALLRDGREDLAEAYLRAHREWFTAADRAAWIRDKLAVRDDLAARGQMRPIYLNGGHGIVDGLTRVACAHVLGWDHIYGRLT